MDVSIIIPMYNEEDNAEITLKKISNLLKKTKKSYEIIVVNDGSRDNTLKLLNQFRKKNRNVKVFSHSKNLGLGRALRTGFEKARGEMIMTMDADLSYDVGYIPLLIEELEKSEDIDIVTGSPYMKGGRVKDVPFFRSVISKIGNRIIGFSMSTNLHTVTSILRAYRHEVIDSVELESEGPEIQPEILAKATALGHKIREIPTTLEGRKKGKSKFMWGPAIKTHLFFSLFERPMILFGIVGLIILFFGLIGGLYVFALYLKKALNPDRPLINLTVLLIIAGIQILFFGFIATQIVYLKKQIFKIQRDNLKIKNKIK